MVFDQNENSNQTQTMQKIFTFAFSLSCIRIFKYPVQKYLNASTEKTLIQFYYKITWDILREI